MLFNFKGMTREELIQAVKRLMVRQVLAALVFLVLIYLIFSEEPAYLFGVGLLWSLADTSMVFSSTIRGIDSTPQGGKRLLKITFAIRLLLAMLLVFVVIRMKLGLLPVLLAFVLMHIFLIANLLIFTRQTKNSKLSVVEKGGKEDGSC